ncbi:hypothetical protein D3C87_1248720 [compost metagenome]
MSSGTAPAAYKGQFDELQIFNYPLNTTEVTALFTQEFLSTDKFSQNKSTTIIYPNPVKDQIFIQIPDYNVSDVTATLVDITGKIILKEKVISNGNGIFVLNVANKNISGVYILNVSGENLNSNFKIVAE